MPFAWLKNFFWNFQLKLNHCIIWLGYFKDGIESIEAAYQTFVDGSQNLESTLTGFEYYIVELQTNFNQHLKPEKLEEYFRIVKKLHGEEICNKLFDYILVVKGKYLQIMTVFYIFKNDMPRVQNIFERFNDHYNELKGGNKILS